MTTREEMTELLIREVQESALLIREGRYEQLRLLRRDQDKFINLLESTSFIEDFSSGKEEQVSSKEEHAADVVRPNEVQTEIEKIRQSEPESNLPNDFVINSYSGPLLDFFKDRDLELVNKFIDNELEDHKQKEERFKKYIDKEAVFNKSGIALNPAAFALQEFRNMAREKEENTNAKRDENKNLPEETILKKVEPLNIKVVKRASRVKEDKEREPKVLVEGAFHKHVSGGNVKDHNISEAIIRSMCLEDGEVLKVINSPSGACPYTVERTGQKQEVKPSTLQIFNLAIVEKDEQERLFIQRTVNGELLSERTNQSTFYPNSRMITRHSLEEGNLVELRWFKNSPESMNVSWVYKQEEITPIQHSERTRIIKKEKEPLSTAPIQNYAFDLQGLKVLIVGGAPFWPNWKQTIEANNGELSTYDSKNKKPKREIYEARIAKADVVLFCQNMLSHGTYYMGKAISKKYNVPFTNFTSYGIGNIFETLKKMKEQERVLQDKEESAELDYEKFLSWTNRMIKEVFREEEKSRKKEMLSDWTASYNKNKGHFNREQRRNLSKLYSSMEKFSGTIR